MTGPGQNNHNNCYVTISVNVINLREPKCHIESGELLNRNSHVKHKRQITIPDKHCTYLPTEENASRISNLAPTTGEEAGADG